MLDCFQMLLSNSTCASTLRAAALAALYVLGRPVAAAECAAAEAAEWGLSAATKVGQCAGCPYQTQVETARS
jgi:hypothetical protein